MDLNNLHKIYFLGIGGIGMSALARYFQSKGVEILGYDRTPTKLTGQLEKEGMQIHFTDDLDQIPTHLDLVIYTPAIPEDLGEFIHLKNSGIPIKKRSEILGLLSKEKQTIAVAGTHGKTTVSSLIAHVLYNSEQSCTAFLGGLVKNYDSNLINSPNTLWMVVEADEFDKSFLQLHPNIEVITSTDPDHLDIYGNHNSLKNSFDEFVLQLSEDGILIFNNKANISTSNFNGKKIYSYSLDGPSDYFASNIQLTNHQYHFDLETPGGTIRNLILGIPGMINVENAIAALTVATLTGVTEEEMRQSLLSFEGIKRRFDIHLDEDDITYIDDYAHHPEEIKATVISVRKMYPGKKILGVFQPHLFSRTKDFAKDFAHSLELMDIIILLPIYPAREKPMEGVTSEIILNYIEKSEKLLAAKNELINLLEGHNYDILLTLGAGDIDQLVEPIKDHLLKTIKNPKL